MPHRLLAPLLTVVHLAIFATLAARDWATWFRDILARYIACICGRIGLNSSEHTHPGPPRRGKQPKAPRALAVILADSDGGDISVHKLAEILTWCFQRGICTLFVYRPRAMGAAQWQELAALVRVHSGRDITALVGFGKPCGSGSSTAAGSGRAASSLRQSGSEQHSSGTSTAAHMYMLEAEDARWPLVEAARDAGAIVAEAGGSSAQQWEADDANPAAALRAQLARVASCAVNVEPDIVLVCGQAFTLAGFPPWMLRFSELYHLGALERVTPRQLSRTLHKYSNVTQRFGA